MPHQPTRRTFSAGLAATGALLAGGARAGSGGAEEGVVTLEAAPARVRLRAAPAPETEVWALGGAVPGPVIRVRVGEEARLRLVNRTPAPLALHWHGLRGPNALDGVGGLTQAPVPPGGHFDWRFTPTEPGTFLGRPLVLGGSGEPAERGLAALLIVEEREPPPVDRDIALVVDDWLVGEDGQLRPFGDPAQAATSGRLGNWLTVNGRGVPERIEAPPGSRLRLRIANAANARLMQIRFDELKPTVAAIDSVPTDTFEPLRSTLPFPPGRRYDILLDLPDEPGRTGTVTALLGNGVPLVTIATAGERPSRPPLPPLAALPPSRSLPDAIRLQNALRREVVIAGGARPGADGRPVLPTNPKAAWTLNGAAGNPASPPLFSVKRGSPVALTLVNQTPAAQALHIHGHAVRLLHNLDDGWEPYWLDTLQIPEGRTSRIAFVADNPGRWLLGSTVLERLDAGLWTWFEVT